MTKVKPTPLLIFIVCTIINTVPAYAETETVIQTEIKTAKVNDQKTKANKTAKVADQKTKANKTAKVADQKTKADKTAKVANQKTKADKTAKVADQKTKADKTVKVSDQKTKADKTAKVADQKTKADKTAKVADQKTKANKTAKVADQKTKANKTAKVADQKTKADKTAKVADQKTKADKTATVAQQNNVDETLTSVTKTGETLAISDSKVVALVKQRQLANAKSTINDAIIIDEQPQAKNGKDVLIENMQLGREVNDLQSQVDILVDERGSQQFLYGVITAFLSFVCGALLMKSMFGRSRPRYRTRW